MAKKKIKTNKIEISKKALLKPKFILTTFILIIIFSGFMFNKNVTVYKGLEVHQEVNLEFQTFLDNVTNRNDEKLVFLTVFRDTATDSTLYKKMIEDIIKKYNFEEHYIFYTNQMTIKENKNILKFLDSEITGYPTTFLIRNGKVFDLIWGYQKEISYLSALSEKIDNLDSYLKK